MNEQLRDQLYTALFGTWKGPKRASRMTGRADQDRKYSDIPTYSFGRAHFAEHIDGRNTYAGTLGVMGTAWSGCKDYDDAGEAEIVAALATAATKGITAAAFLLLGAKGEHSGGHLWVLYNHDYSESDIRAQLRTIPRSGKGEDYPSGNPVRLPFGYHKLKRTRGVLILQDGRRFVLDNPDQLIAGIDAFLSLPRNGKPEPAAHGDARVSGAAWGEAYKPSQWEDLPDGGPLWHSAYVAAAAGQRRPDLEKLLRGERVTVIKKDDTRDDSDSAQVAALAFNLLSADVCKPQARAIADYLYTHLRPGKTREHYRAHFDAELERYTPKHYRPKEIHYLGTANRAAPQALPPAEHRPEPKSRARKDRPQQVAGPAGYLAWLRTQVDPQSGSVMLSQKQCAGRLGCCVRTIKRYEKALGTQIERRVFAQRQAGCLFMLSPDVVPTSPADVVIADVEIAQQSAENVQPAIMQVEHTAPVVPSPRPGRAALVAEAFDALDGCKRLTDKRIRQYLEMNYPEVAILPDNLRQLAKNERTKRRHAKQDAKEAAKARAIKRWSSLVKKSQALASQAAQMRRERNKRAPVWERMAGIYAAEESRRIESGEAPTRLLRGRGVDADEQLILAEIDEQRRQQPAKQQGSSAGVCSSPTAPALVQPDLFADAPAQSPYYVAALGLADRLRARQQVQL